MGFIPEGTWLEQLRTGEEEAYKLLFTRYYSTLVLFACRYLNDREQAEDVVHDVFLKLCTQKKEFDTIVILKGYLYASVKNGCLNILKRQKLKERYFEESMREEEFCYCRILETETYELLKEAIAELQDRTRSVFDLTLQGYDNTQISEKLEITLDAVKAYKKRGKKLLKEKLQRLMMIFLF